MNVLKKVAASFDDVIDLILGEGLKSPVELTIKKYPLYIYTQ